MDLPAPGGINAPAATSTADITTVFGMISSVRLEHVGAAVITAGTREQAAHRNKQGRDFITLASDRLLDAAAIHLLEEFVRSGISSGIQFLIHSVLPG
jgi:hypothetical protein